MRTVSRVPHWRLVRLFLLTGSRLTGGTCEREKSSKSATGWMRATTAGGTRQSGNPRHPVSESLRQTRNTPHTEHTAASWRTIQLSGRPTRTENQNERNPNTLRQVRAPRSMVRVQTPDGHERTTRAQTTRPCQSFAAAAGWALEATTGAYTCTQSRGGCKVALLLAADKTRRT